MKVALFCLAHYSSTSCLKMILSSNQIIITEELQCWNHNKNKDRTISAQLACERDKTQRTAALEEFNYGNTFVYYEEVQG